MATRDISAIFRDGCLVEVHVSCWSGAKALTPEDLGLDPSKVDEKFAHLGKKWLIPEETISAFHRIDALARRVIIVNGHSFPIGGARYVPKKLMQKVFDELTKLRDKYDALADKLVEEFDTLRTQMQPVFLQAAETAYFQQLPAETEFSIESQEADKATFIKNFLDRIEAVYPSRTSLRSRFSLDWDIFEVSAPKSDIATEEWQKAIHNKIDGFMTDVVKNLRSETYQICNKVSQILKDGKAVKTTTLNSLKNFIQHYRDLNFVGDMAVEAQLDALQKELLDIYPADQINSVPEVNESLKQRLVKIGELASEVTDLSSITGEYKRKIQWEDTEDNPAEAA